MSLVAKTEQTNDKKKMGISGSTLKIIAIVTMLIDHIGASIIEVGILDLRHNSYAQLMRNPDYIQWIQLDNILRLIGRVAFPIFCFLLVEGFLHTRDVKKYATRLLIFAAVSEIPFDLAIYHSFFETSHQNVFFTLFIGLLVMIGLKKFEQNKAIQLLIFLIGCFSAVILRTDYDYFGILLIIIFYVLRKNALAQTIVASLLLITSEITAIFAFIPIRLYNGERGLNLKYLFYWFYPVHLLILYIISAYLV